MLCLVICIHVYVVFLESVYAYYKVMYAFYIILRHPRYTRIKTISIIVIKNNYY